MNILGDLPTWAIVLVCLLAVTVLLVTNLGWLLAIKAKYYSGRDGRSSAAPGWNGKREKPPVSR